MYGIISRLLYYSVKQHLFKKNNVKLSVVRVRMCVVQIERVGRKKTPRFEF